MFVYGYDNAVYAFNFLSVNIITGFTVLFFYQFIALRNISKKMTERLPKLIGGLTDLVFN